MSPQDVPTSGVASTRYYLWISKGRAKLLEPGYANYWASCRDLFRRAVSRQGASQSLSQLLGLNCRDSELTIDANAGAPRSGSGLFDNHLRTQVYDQARFPHLSLPLHLRTNTGDSWGSSELWYIDRDLESIASSLGPVYGLWDDGRDNAPSSLLDTRTTAPQQGSSHPKGLA